MKAEAIVNEDVLVAVTGMSPGVLTETVWALAHEQPAILPHRIVVLTTQQGQAVLEKALFAGGEQGGWARLKAALRKKGLPTAGRLCFGPAQAHVRLFPRADGTADLPDIASSADNAAVADFILRELRAVTEEQNTRVLASIAGGRKTMGALLMACMSLLGREQDRVLHVLVNPPFDTSLEPPFIFPEHGVRHALKDGGRKIRSTEARIELIDVPFVRMRGWYEQAFQAAPPSYARLVAGVQRQAPAARTSPGVVVDGADGTMRVGDTDCVLNPTEFAAVGSLLSLFAGGRPVSQLRAVVAQMQALQNLPPATARGHWVGQFCDAAKKKKEFYDPENKDYSEQVRKLLSSARQKLRRCLGADLAAALLPDFRGSRPQAYPAKRLKMVNWPLAVPVDVPA